MFEIMEKDSQEAVIKVIGVGGCGGNAVEHMIGKNVSGVEFICANTDVQALKKSSATTTLQIGIDITKGLGAGAKPEVGRDAALEVPSRRLLLQPLVAADSALAHRILPRQNRPPTPWVPALSGSLI